MATDHITLGEPIVGEPELEAIVDVFETGWVINGPTTREFEQRFAELVEADHAIAVTNCTIGMEMSLRSAGLERGARVIVPALGFIANAIAIREAEFEPLFVDVDTRTYNMDPEDVAEWAEHADAVMPLHYSGLPCDMDWIQDIAEEHGLFIVEDAAHALGATYRGDPIGSHGDAVVFSFGPLKVITTGMGGMITTDSDHLAESLRNVRSYGMDQAAYDREDEERPWRYEISERGHNYRMSDVAAGMGLAQLDRMEDFLRWRAEAVGDYNERLITVDGIKIPPDPGWANRVDLYYVIRVMNDYPLSRDDLALRLMENDIGCSVHWDPPLHTHALPEGSFRPLPRTERLSNQLLTLPLHPQLTKDEVDRVVDVIENPVD